MKCISSQKECHPRISRNLVGESGQSVIQMTISIGLLSIMTMVFATMITNQAREARALSEKLAAMDLQQFLLSTLADGTVCTYVLNNPSVLTFDATRPFPQTIVLPSSPGAEATLFASMPSAQAPSQWPVAARVGRAASPLVESLQVQSIQLQITGGGLGSYSGNWLVTFDTSRSVRAIKPVSVSAQITVDESIPTAARITDCQGVHPSVGSCPAGSVLIGTPNGNGSYCIERDQRAATTFLAAKTICGSLQPAGFGRAHVCTHDQWYTACLYGTGMLRMRNDSEWMSEVSNSGNNAALVAGNAGTCDYLDGEQYSNNHTFRCCFP